MDASRQTSEVLLFKYKFGGILEEFCPGEALARSEDVQPACIPLIGFGGVAVRFVFGAVGCR